MKEDRNRNLIILHLVVLLWGFTGILGREISLDAFRLVWWRVAIATVAIAVYALYKRIKPQISWRLMLKLAGIGFLTAAHWVCFFMSIKESTVSAALAVISTTTLFVSLIAPLIRKEKFHLYEVLMGVVVVAGLVIIFKFETRYTLGIILSLAAALLAALFSSFNSTLAGRHSPVVIAFWEMFFALAGITVFLLLKGDFGSDDLLPGLRDFGLLLFLGVVCTGLAFIISIQVMKVLSPFTCALAINLEPVYTILMALAIYGEEEYMSPQFYLGALVILSTIFLESWLKNRTLASSKEKG
jgi:drug/metabolite transporter (DMT)-like permease